MNFDDFKTWMNSAQSAFPSLKQWLGQQSADARKETWKQWRKVLDSVSLDVGQQAIDRIVRDNKLQPFGGKWEQLPGIILGLCSGATSRPKGVNRCICHGEGIVLVGVRKPVLTDGGNPLRQFQHSEGVLWGPIGAACLCPVGKWLNRCREQPKEPGRQPMPLPVYDPKLMVCIGKDDDIFKPAIEQDEQTAMQSASMIERDLP